VYILTFHDAKELKKVKSMMTSARIVHMFQVRVITKMVLRFILGININVKVAKSFMKIADVLEE
jgi:hypothetical protein